MGCVKRVGLCPFIFVIPIFRGSDVKSYLCYFASNNRAPLRFRDGIWVMNTENLSIVPPFICVEELRLSVLRWDWKVPREADATGPGRGPPTAVSPVLTPLPSTS